MKPKIAVMCLMAVVSLTACSSDSKRTPPDNPNYNSVASGNTPPFKPSSIGTPAPFKSPTPSAMPYDPISLLMQLASEDPKVSYEQLKKNADCCKSQAWVFTGRIFQIQESEGHTFALVSLDEWGNKMVAVKADFTTDFVEKDQVTVVGYVDDNYSYTSVAGWELTVPAIDARAILKPSEAARIKAGKKVSKP